MAAQDWKRAQRQRRSKQTASKPVAQRARGHARRVCPDIKGLGFRVWGLGFGV